MSYLFAWSYCSWGSQGKDQFSSVQLFSCVRLFVIHESQHTRPPWPSQTPGVYSNYCSSSRWCHQPSQPLSSPSFPTPNHSKHQGLFQWVKSLHDVAKVCFVCALQESVFPELWKFCNQMPSGFQSQIPWGFSVPLQDPQIGESVVGPRTFITVCKFLWYNCSPVCELSSQWLYGETNGDLLQKDLCHTPCLQICCSQSFCPRCRPLLTCVSTGDTQKHKGCSGSVSCGVSWVLVCTSFCLSPPSISGRYGVWFKCILAPLTVLLGLLLWQWSWEIFLFVCFWWYETFSCQLFLSVCCNFGVLIEDEHSSFYTTTCEFS